MRTCSAAGTCSVLFALCMAVATGAFAFDPARDPGPRAGAAGAGGPLKGLTPDEINFFREAREIFQEVDSVSGAVAGEEGSGLGPTFNANSCASCHVQPAIGG